jgi:heat shock protein HtpX
MQENEPGTPVVHSFTIGTELSHSQLLNFPSFIREHMAFGQLPGVRMAEMGAYASSKGHYMEFRSGPQRGVYTCSVRVYLESPMKVEIRSAGGRDEVFEKQLENVLLMVVQFFEEQARTSTLYIAFLPGSPRTANLGRSFSLFRAIFSGNMMTLFLLSIIIGVFILSIMSLLGYGDYAPYVLIALLLSLVLSAGKLSSLRSPWKITSSTREVVIVQHQVPEGMLALYVGEFRDKIAVAKRRTYEMLKDRPADASREKVAEVFRDSGLPAKPEDFLVKRVDVLSIVERVAQRYDMPVPAIVVSQDARPNAAATGFTKRLATVIVTMGLLVQLEEEEIEVVIGHELSHLRSGDPIILFSLIVGEYLVRVKFLMPLMVIIPGFWLLYIVGVFWCIFFFGKFLESRADLEAALVMRKPKVMAESLKKIGFRRLVLTERFLEPGGSRLGEWVRFDPHPPLYFRIQRLESLDLENPPRHPFLSSVRAVMSGFISSRNIP